MRYDIDYTPTSLRQARALGAGKREEVIDKLEHQLLHEPLMQTNNRKPLRADPNLPAAAEYWELRLGDIRVFYFVLTQPAPSVKVVAIGEKERDLFRIGGKTIASAELIALLESIREKEVN